MRGIETVAARLVNRARALARHPLAELTRARWYMFVREPGAVFWTFVFPLLASLALGSAFRSQPAPLLPVAVEDGAGSEELLRALRSEPQLRLSVVEAGQAPALLRRGSVVLVVAAGAPRRYRYDATRLEGRLARALCEAAVQRALGRIGPDDALDERHAGARSPYVEFLVPGLIGLNLASAGAWGVGQVMVDLRARRLLRRLSATPMKRGHFLVSFVILRMLFLALEVPVLLAFVAVAFGVVVQGSWLAFVSVLALGAAAFAGLGLLAGSRAENSHAVEGLLRLVMVPMVACSGVFFPAQRFPAALQPFIAWLPLRTLADALRAVMVEGAGLAAMAVPLLILSAWTAVTLVLAWRLFRWN